MDIDTPPPISKAIKIESLENGNIEDGPPPHSPATITTPSHPPLTTLNSDTIIAGPSNSSQIEVSTSDKNKNGYWKMKSAEASKHQPSSSSSKYNQPDDLPLSAYTANTIDNNDIIQTPNTTTSSFTQLPLELANYGSTPISQPKKRGRKKISPPPLLTTKGISLVFRMPPGSNQTSSTPPNNNNTQNTNTPNNIASGSGSIIRDNTNINTRDSTPDQSNTSLGSVEGSKRRRVNEPSVSNPRPIRSRPSPINTPLTGSPIPSNPNPNNNSALSIFAPAPPIELPEALQSSIPPTGGDGINTPIPIPINDADAIRKEAAAGFESRLRSRTNLVAGQRRDGGERTGVSASGKDVRVGGTARTAEKASNNLMQNNVNNNTGGGNKKKGKGKADVDVPNQDFCSACRGIGRFLCCDGCPRSFHFMCLEPPLRIDELPDEETWYCKKCRAERLKESGENSSPTKEKEMKPIPMVFKQLSKKVDDENPCQFRLPQVIRTYFAGVGTASRGEYVDADEARTKFDRKGFQEDRDPLRTRDGKNKPITCYSCGGSSLPNHSLTTDPESTWRQIVSCDYCPLSWHLDCLDPPLSSMPNPARKWMCPNHYEQALPRKRTVRNDLETVEIESRNQPNNGNITIIPEPELPKGPLLDYEDLVINRKKFRVPEKIIRLDFWEKIMQKGGILKPDGFSTNNSITNPTQEDIEAANLILSFFQTSDPISNNQDQPNDNGNSAANKKISDESTEIEIDQTSILPTPSSPLTPPRENTKPPSSGRTKIVLRMPGTQPSTPK